MQEPQISTTSFCSQCGAPLAQGALFCSKCGTPVTVVEVSPTVPVPVPLPPKPIGLQTEIVSNASMNAGCLSLVMWAGFLGAAYFLLFFDTSIATEVGRVSNIGLMQDRQNYMLFCGGVGIVALIIKQKSKPSK